MPEEPLKTTPSPELTALSIANSPTVPEESETLYKPRYTTGGGDDGVKYHVSADGTRTERGVYDEQQRQKRREDPAYQEKQFMRMAQGSINSLRKYEQERLAEQAQINQKNDRSTQSVNTLTGLAGSTEANVQQQKTTEVGQRANDKIRAETELEVQTILGNVKKSAVDQAKFEREQARLDETARLEARTARQQEAVTQLSTLAQSGATAEGYATTDPEGYQYLAQQVGGEDVLKAMFTLNRSTDQVLDKRIEGGKYVVAYQNPLTGKVSIETVDLGLPTGYTKTIDAGDRILAVPDNWSGDPSELITINKGLSPSSAASGTKGDLTPYQTFQATQSLKKSLQTKTAAANELKRQTTIMNDTWNRLENGEAEDLNATSQAIVITFNKLLDPTSVVRESEYDRTGQGQALLSSIEGKIAAISQGGPGLTKESLKELVDLGNTYARNAQAHIDAQTALAKEEAEFFGLNPEFVAGGLDATPSTANTSKSSTIKGPDGQLYDASELTPEEYQQALDEGYIAQ